MTAQEGSYCSRSSIRDGNPAAGRSRRSRGQRGERSRRNPAPWMEQSTRNPVESDADFNAGTPRQQLGAEPAPLPPLSVPRPGGLSPISGGGTRPHRSPALSACKQNQLHGVHPLLALAMTGTGSRGGAAGTPLLRFNTPGPCPRPPVPPAPHHAPAYAVSVKIRR